MQQPITGYHTDEEGHWVAQLACGHNQHVRHNQLQKMRRKRTTRLEVRLLAANAKLAAEL